jgi:hypothetical protein
MEYISGGYQGPQAKDHTLYGQQPQYRALCMACLLLKSIEYLMAKGYFWSSFCEHSRQRP